jgi:hypothetical protein
MFLTLIPIGIHSYAKVRGDECIDPDHLAAVAGFRPVDAARARTLLSWYDGEQFWEGDIELPGRGTRLKYVVVRSYNAKRLYYRPEYRYIKEVKPRSHRIDWIAVDGSKVPIHRPIYARSGSQQGIQMMAYLLLYEGRTIEDPYRAQLLRAPFQLIRGSRPMTLMMVSGLTGASDFDAAEERAREWLIAARRSYLEVCGL